MSDPKKDPLVGTVIADRFLIMERLAAGGMGVVYKAEQQPLGRKVAVKILRSPKNPSIDLQFGKRFLLEAAAVANLSHPNTIVVHDYGQVDEDTLYLAMEFLDGVTVADQIVERGPLTPHHAIHVGLQIASSLGEAHQQGLVHRDLKPGNVMITKRGANPLFVKVLDFGLVKMVGQDQSLELTQSGVMMGSPAYMAPEQVQARNVDHRCDIYSFGIVMYFMLTGTAPFDGESQFEVMRAHVCSEPPPLRSAWAGCQAPASLEALIMHCLRKHPAERPASMDVVSQHLMACEAELGFHRPMSSAGFPVPALASGQHATITPSGAHAGAFGASHQITPSEGYSAHAMGSGAQNYGTGGQVLSPSQAHAQSVQAALSQGQPNPAIQTGGHRTHSTQAIDPGSGAMMAHPGHPMHQSGGSVGGVPVSGRFDTGAKRWALQMLVIMGVAALAAGAAIGVPMLMEADPTPPPSAGGETTGNGTTGNGTTGDGTANGAQNGSSENSNDGNQTNAAGNGNATDGNETDGNETDGNETDGNDGNETDGNDPETPVIVMHSVEVTSRPAGASVFRGDEELGITPLTIEVPEGESWELTVTRRGFSGRTVTVDGSESNIELRLTTPRTGPVEQTTTTMESAMETTVMDTAEMEARPTMMDVHVHMDLRNPWAR